MQKKSKILVVEDDQSMNYLLRMALKEEGYEVNGAFSLRESYEEISSEVYDVILLDLKLPDGNGMELIDEMSKSVVDTRIIVLTAHGTINTAVEAVKKGAYNFITKPFEMEKLLIEIKRAIETINLLRENADLKSLTSESLDWIVGESDTIKEVKEKIRTVSSLDIEVLITGESGTGKELVAHAIHYLSPRKKKPFIAINCGAIPEDLMESELFGYEKGAFTGAISSKPGKFELANDGTLFLDEIGELPKNAQVKLLRVLEDHKVERVGSTRSRDVDVRIISATNRNLEEEMKKGTFRDDLYYRIKVFTIEMPPLRERKEDIPLLLNYFLNRYSAELGKDVRKVSPEVARVFQAYDFPGNIRELQNILKSAIVSCQTDTISPGDLPRGLDKGKTMDIDVPVGLPLKEIEKAVIIKTLKHFKGDKAKTARALNMSLSSLYNKINQWKIPV
ncbi:MAG: sigma-54-dependent Fis family transcriptional regulator [Thermotogae bacterium]|nr:sigma-54-dependent Fis family transcriptional regulator [Thermotogota bacterium]